MAISELLNTRSEAILKDILGIAHNARDAYTTLEKKCDLGVQMKLYAAGELVSFVRMAEIRSIRDRVKALQAVEDDAITMFTTYSSKLSQYRAQENERDFFNTLGQAERERYKLEGDIILYAR